MVAIEALVRWDHEERGLIPPADFIAAAEATGVIVPVGEWYSRRRAASFVRGMSRS